MDATTFQWAVGLVLGTYVIMLGWLWKKIEKHDDRMRHGISYEEADNLIDLKLQPVRESLDRNTRATEQLTEALVMVRIRQGE